MAIDLVNKYKPTKYTELTTNLPAINSIRNWLMSYDKNKKQLFKMRQINKQKKIKNFKGLDNFTSCILVTGGHGVGKTLSIELILNEFKWNIHALDINIIRTTKNIEALFHNIMTTSNVLSIINGSELQRNVIVIDEIESISSTVEKKNILALQKINDQKLYCPIIFIANSQHHKLVADLRKICTEIKFWPPFPSDMKKILMRVANKENIKIQNDAVMTRILVHSQGDIRRLINTLEDIKNAYGNKLIDSNLMDEYCSTSTKKDVNIELNKATSKLLYEYTNIEECLRLFESEKVLLPLMIHHNYINSVIANEPDVKDQFSIICQISDFLSEGDVIENYIYGDQNWDMQEIHGLYTCVFPSYHLCENLDEDDPVKPNLEFTTDLNKTSIKKINKKNIINTDICLKNMNIDDYIYINKIIRKLIDSGNIAECAKILQLYNIKLEHIESLIKIDKIKHNKVALTSKQKNEFSSFLK
jgi:DNA polymerase III delta prime subunit